MAKKMDTKIKNLNYAILLCLAYMVIRRILQIVGIFRVMDDPNIQTTFIYIGLTTAFIMLCVNIVLMIFIYKRKKWAYNVTGILYILLYDWRNISKINIHIIYNTAIYMVLTFGSFINMYLLYPTKK